MRFEPRPRLVDWTILLAVALALVTGVVSLGVGTPRFGWVFVLHGAGALVLVVLLFWKLRRVRRRVTGRWNRTVALSVLLAFLALSALATGIAWVLGYDLDLWGWTLLNLHIGLGLVVVPVLLVHLAARFRTPTTADWEGRRTVLQYGALVLFGALAWRAQQALVAVLDTAGADRRFTGSKPHEGSGNRFPVTSWVLDDPDPIAPETWRLHVAGAVERPLELGYDALDARREERALLDCTSGWFVERDWRGVPVADLLDDAGVTGEARWVTFHSVTGYRFGFPVDVARGMLLATHVDGERLTHGHGFPLRLVAPGKRGFQWVKWVTAVEVREERDWGQWLAIFVSGLD
ncbi:molybdopterin-dependent oxidoreductase [Halomarina ordinaria]|uniref:Molybdopterin-dependent oxidoreductase n=1 Tax=Halomarina ordinaria TaxID=3033939 RepID=A0ABD5UAK9_9EURY|nr:molybdopterin-dependent oxidoreductase [Halomarina sp. PSRA2]